jgi:hypothetical protein
VYRIKGDPVGAEDALATWGVSRVVAQPRVTRRSEQEPTLIMGPLLGFDFQKLRPYPTSQKALNPALFCLIFACVVRPYRVRSDY